MGLKRITCTQKERRKQRSIFLSTPDSIIQYLNNLIQKPRKFIYGSYSYRNGDVFNKEQIMNIDEYDKCNTMKTTIKR